MTRSTILAIVIALFVVVIPVKVWIFFATKETVTSFVVQDKERVITGSGDNQESKYLIFTDKETFENTDSFLAFKFNSSDVYGAIPIGATCDFTVAGLRVPFLSWYRNILSATCH